MKTKLVALSVLAASVVSASSMAADVANSGQLIFNWQGIVPTNPIVNGSDWAFVDGMDNIFIPSTEQLRVNLDSTGNMTAVSVKGYDLFIVPVDTKVTSGHVTRSTTKTFATTNPLTAYLGSVPVSNGFVGNKQLSLAASPVAGDNEVAVTLNGTVLKVGSANGVDVAVDTAKKEAHANIQLNAKALKANVTEGSTINFTAPVIFAANIASSAK